MSISTVLSRIQTIQKRIVSDSSAVTVATYVQDGKPYWTNKFSLARLSPSPTSLRIEDWVITMFLHFGNIGERYDTTLETALVIVAENIITQFSEHNRLGYGKATDADYLAPVDSIAPDGVALGRLDMQLGSEFNDVLMLVSTLQVRLEVNKTVSGTS